MPLESVTHISDLVATNPTSTDPKSEGDNHLRNIKTALKTDFPNISGPVTKTHTQLNNALDKTGDTMTGTLVQSPTDVNAHRISADTAAKRIFWGDGATRDLSNIWSSQNGGRLTLAQGLMGGTGAANQFLSSVSTSWGRAAVEFDFGAIKFFTDAATTTAYGTVMTPTERGSFDNTGNFTLAASLRNAAGTAALPSYTFTGDTNTGIYSPGADQVAVAIGGTQALAVDASRNVLVTGSGGLGYGVGSGGTVAQATSRTTGVTLNKPSGAITLFSTTTTAGTFASFTLTNSSIAATDGVEVCFASGATANSYGLLVTAVAAGSCRIQIHNIAAVGTAEAPVIQFRVIKAATS